MAIERISFPEGLRVTNLQEFDPNETVLKNLNRLESLPVGEIDLTPARWTRNKYLYLLNVTDMGTGILHLTPKFRDSASGFRDQNSEVNFERGPRIIRILEEQPMFVVLGTNDDLTHSAYEFIFYMPNEVVGKFHTS